MTEDEARRLVEGAKVARLGTLNADGGVDLVPIVFALVGDRLVTAVDHKPKRTEHLRRLDNVRARPEVTVLVDHYDDADWDALWWVRLRGRAVVVEPTHPVHGELVDALVARYDQYRDRRPAGPALVVEVLEWRGWSAAG